MAYALFITSILLTLGFAGVRSFEERRGRRYGVGIRSALDAHVLRIAQWISNLQLLELVKLIGTRVYRKAEHDLALLALSVVRILERRLARVVSAIRGKRRMERREASEAAKQVEEDITPQA